jgi:hypothetical protein
MKILKTNWINLIGVFIAIFLYALILNLNDTTVVRNLFQSILSALMLVCLYGFIFWILFILLLILFDLLLIVKKQLSYLKIKLFIEWIIISAPFIYWIFKFKEIEFLVGVIVFLITQFIREKLIKKVP